MYRVEIIAAASAADLERLRDLVAKGGNLNQRDQWGDTVLSQVIQDLYDDEKPFRYEVVRTLIDLGADVNLLGEEKWSPMHSAMLQMDTEMLRLLLDAGADPNKPGGFGDSETMYDWAEFDYRYEIYDITLPEEATPEDKLDEDSWLRFLDRLAVKRGVRRPDHLFLLRERGARTSAELATAATSRPVV